MQRYIEKFIRYLEIEKNYSAHTVLNTADNLRRYEQSNSIQFQDSA